MDSNYSTMIHCVEGSGKLPHVQCACSRSRYVCLNEVCMQTIGFGFFINKKEKRTMRQPMFVVRCSPPFAS